MLRAFTDSSGTEWRVWDVLPSATTQSFSAGLGGLSSLMGTAFASGWLCFESGAEKRRLAPIPTEWVESGERDLERLCSRAVVVAEPRRRTSDERRAG
jgi:hypothetical protein